MDYGKGGFVSLNQKKSVWFFYPQHSRTIIFGFVFRACSSLWLRNNWIHSELWQTAERSYHGSPWFCNYMSAGLSSSHESLAMFASSAMQCSNLAGTQIDQEIQHCRLFPSCHVLLCNPQVILGYRAPIYTSIRTIPQNTYCASSLKSFSFFFSFQLKFHN